MFDTSLVVSAVVVLYLQFLEHVQMVKAALHGIEHVQMVKAAPHEIEHVQMV